MRPVDRLVAVDAPLTDTWQTLIDAEKWPEWVSGLRSVEVHPPGKVDRNTSATLRYTSGRSMYVAVTEFRPGRSFRWTGRFFGSSVSYDHVVTSAGRGSEILFIMEVTGPTARFVGPWLGRAYARQLDGSIPRLKERLAEG